jgi:hypothetical protein
VRWSSTLPVYGTSSRCHHDHRSLAGQATCFYAYCGCGSLKASLDCISAHSFRGSRNTLSCTSSSSFLFSILDDCESSPAIKWFSENPLIVPNPLVPSGSDGKSVTDMWARSADIKLESCQRHVSLPGSRLAELIPNEPCTQRFPVWKGA